MIAVNRPRPSSTLTPRNATTCASPLPYTFHTPSARAATCEPCPVSARVGTVTVTVVLQVVCVFSQTILGAVGRDLVRLRGDAVTGFRPGAYPYPASGFDPETARPSCRIPDVPRDTSP